MLNQSPLSLNWRKYLENMLSCYMLEHSFFYHLVILVLFLKGAAEYRRKLYVQLQRKMKNVWYPQSVEHIIVLQSDLIFSVLQLFKNTIVKQICNSIYLFKATENNQFPSQLFCAEKICQGFLDSQLSSKSPSWVRKANRCKSFYKHYVPYDL